MKINQLILLLILSFFSIISFGQYEKFDLGKYKNPFYKRQQLDLNFGLYGSDGSNKPTDEENPLKNSSSSLSGNLTGTYYSIQNSAKKQSNWLVSLNENSFISNYKHKYNPDSFYVKTNSKANDLTLNIGTNNRFYFSNLYFFEIDFNGNGSNRLSNLTSDYYGKVTNHFLYNEENKNSSSSFSGEIGLRIGKGRIEYLEDARLAIYILEDLNKHNRLSRVPKDEEVLEFAKVITQIKNKRFFDSRNKKIEEITKVDSFLLASNLVNKGDAAYFTTLDDNWVNASGPSRTSGFRSSIGISPSGMWSQQKNSNYYTDALYSNSDNTYNYNKKGIAGDLQVDYNKPLSLKWQLNGGLSLKYLLSDLKIETKNNIDNVSSVTRKEHLHELTGNLFMELGFYPNSRTSFIGSISLNSRYANNTMDDPYIISDKGDFHYIFPNLSLNGNYYISERLRLRTYYSISYSYSKTADAFYYSSYQSIYTNSKTYNQNFSVSLSYAFF